MNSRFLPPPSTSPVANPGALEARARFARRRRNRGGFTLVEIALAIAILAFAFLPLVALLPTGLHDFRGAMNLSITTQIAQQVISDAQQSDFDLLTDRRHFPKDAKLEGFSFRAPLINAPALRYFDEQGAEILLEGDKPNAAEKHRVVYQVNTRVQPQTAVPADKPTNALPATIANLALVTVEVAFAPGNLELPFSDAQANDATAPDRNLFKRTRGLEIYTYSSLIGRSL